MDNEKFSEFEEKIDEIYGKDFIKLIEDFNRLFTLLQISCDKDNKRYSTEFLLEEGWKRYEKWRPIMSEISKYFMNFYSIK